MYTQCLRKLGRIEDDVQVSLKLLAKLVQRDGQASGIRHRPSNSTSGKQAQSASSASQILRDLLVNSKNLNNVVRAPIERYFRDAALSPYLRHLPNHGQFELDLTIHQDISNGLELDEIRVKLTSLVETAGSEIWLQSRDMARLQRGKSIVPLISSVRRTSCLDNQSSRS